MNRREIIENKAKEILDEKDFLLIDFVWRGTEQKPVVELFIDSKESITVDDCYNVSRELEKFIDEERLLIEYRLDVSSPGVDRPLRYLEQYYKHKGRKFEIDYVDENQRYSFTGKLIDIVDNILIFEKSGKNKEILEINFSGITKAKVLISF